MSFRLFNTIVTLLLCTFLSAQQSQFCIDANFQQEIDKYIAYSVPSISVSELAEQFDDYILLDAREEPEFNISHIKGAIHVGYNSLKYDELKKLDKDANIVVYCSIGYRSEKIAEYLEAQGFKHVQNLIGSIFEWSNQGHGLVDNQSKPTRRVHAYSKDWQRWLSHPEIQKILKGHE